MTDEQEQPFWRKPLPPIQRRKGDGLEASLRDVWPPESVSMTVDENPAPSKSLDNIEPPRANEDEPSHDDTTSTTPEAIPEPELTRRLRTTAAASQPIRDPAPQGAEKWVDEFGELPPAPAPAPQPVRGADPIEALRQAALALDLARATARQCRETVQTSRGVFSRALAAWNLTLPVQTALDAAREFCATSQASRAARAAAGRLQRPATISETAKAYSGGGHNVQRGHGRAYARGAMSRASAMETESLRLRGAATAARMAGSNAPRVKLPSEK
jgi:hypothetical protein